MREFNTFAKSYQMMCEMNDDELKNQRRMEIESGELLLELLLFTLKPDTD